MADPQATFNDFIAGAVDTYDSPDGPSEDPLGSQWQLLSSATTACSSPPSSDDWI
jgi:hypothetical protein